MRLSLFDPADRIRNIQISDISTSMAPLKALPMRLQGSKLRSTVGESELYHPAGCRTIGYCPFMAVVEVYITKALGRVKMLD